MIVALIDNGSLEPAAHRNLRTVAAALSARVGVNVAAVSWKHSDRIPPRAFLGAATGDLIASIDGAAPIEARSDSPNGAWTLAPFIRAQVALGQRDFLFVPFFISAQGAIGSALRGDLEKLRAELGHFEFAFADSLAARGALPEIVAARICETILDKNLSRPAVIIVDHGGPSAVSAALRDQIAASVRVLVSPEIGPLAAASMEGGEHAHNRPLLADALALPAFARGDVVIAPLFLSPGRHAGPNGDLARIARAASPEPVERAAGRATPLRCHFTELVGTHPAVIDTLAAALRDALTPTPTSLSA